MHKDDIIVGIDIGSINTKTVIAQDFPDVELPRVTGVGVVPSSGMRRGAIVDIDEATRVINESVEQAEKMAGVTVRKVVLSLGGADVSFQNSKGVVAVSRADGQVAEADIERVVKEAQSLAIPPNKEIVHVVPRNYRLDDQVNIKDPLGMHGVRLEADAMVIEVAAAYIKNLTKAAEQAGVEIEDLVLKSLAVSKSILNKRQKELGVALVNIGGSTTSVTVFEEDELLHTAVLPIGSAHITNDIAIGLRTSIEVAEKIKLEFGSALSRDINRKEDIDLAQIDSSEVGRVSRHHVVEIIEARLEEIFSMVDKQLKSIGKSGLLPSGIVLTGGGAKLPEIVTQAKELLKLPAQIGYPINMGGIMNKVDDPSFAAVIGLVLWEKEKRNFSGGMFSKDKMLGNLTQGTENSLKKVKHWFEKFLP